MVARRFSGFAAARANRVRFGRGTDHDAPSQKGSKKGGLLTERFSGVRTLGCAGSLICCECLLLRFMKGKP